MNENLHNELTAHVQTMLYTVGHSTQEFTLVIVRLWSKLQEISGEDNVKVHIEKALKKHGGTPQQHIEIQNNIMDKFDSFFRSDLHFYSMFEFMIEMEDMYLASGTTLQDAFRDNKIHLPFQADHDFYLNKLLTINGEPQRLFAKWAYLFTGFYFYRNFMKKETIRQNDIALLLRVDREIGFIREEVAEMIALADSSIEKMNRALQGVIVTPIKTRETISKIKDVMTYYRKKGESFSSRDSFCEKFEHEEYFRSKGDPAMTSRTVWNNLIYMEIDSDISFKEFYANIPTE